MATKTRGLDQQRTLEFHNAPRISSKPQPERGHRLPPGAAWPHLALAAALAALLLVGLLAPTAADLRPPPPAPTLPECAVGNLVTNEFYVQLGAQYDRQDAEAIASAHGGSLFGRQLQLHPTEPGFAMHFPCEGTSDAEKLANMNRLKGLLESDSRVTEVIVNTFHCVVPKSPDAKVIVNPFRCAVPKPPDAATEAPGMISGKRPRTSVGPGSITVSWPAPDKTGGVDASALTYEVRYGIGSCSARTSWPIVNAGSTQSRTIAGLTPGIQYQVQVRARNSQDAGPWSYIARATPQAEGAMGEAEQAATEAPGMIQGKRPSASAGSGSITMSWPAPGKTGGVDASALTYEVRYGTGERSERPSWPILSAGAGSSYTIAGLIPGTEYQVQVRAVNDAGTGPWSYVAQATPQAAAKRPFDKLRAAPDSPQLQQNAPNPFNNQTVISYFLHAPGPARLEVFASTGQRVAVLHQGPQQAGYHRLAWDGRDDAGRPLASGIYLYRLVTTENVLTRKLLLLR